MFKTLVPDVRGPINFKLSYAWSVGSIFLVWGGSHTISQSHTDADSNNDHGCRTLYEKSTQFSPTLSFTRKTFHHLQKMLSSEQLEKKKLTVRNFHRKKLIFPGSFGLVFSEGLPYSSRKILFVKYWHGRTAARSLVSLERKKRLSIEDWSTNNHSQQKMAAVKKRHQSRRCNFVLIAIAVPRWLWFESRLFKSNFLPYGPTVGFTGGGSVNPQNAVFYSL